MVNHPYLETVRRLLSAETYVRSREEAKAREPERPDPKEKPQ